jgi:hypothetical protein
MLFINLCVRKGFKSVKGIKEKNNKLINFIIKQNKILLSRYKVFI